MRKLIQLCAFYRNDQPDGVGITLTEGFGDLDRILATLTESWDDMWRRAVRYESTDSLVRSMCEHLDEIGRTGKPIRTTVTAYRVIGDVYLLEHVGTIKADEWNGLLLVYRET